MVFKKSRNFAITQLRSDEPLTSQKSKSPKVNKWVKRVFIRMAKTDRWTSPEYVEYVLSEIKLLWKALWGPFCATNFETLIELWNDDK